MSLTAQETELCREIGFTSEVAEVLKAATGKTLARLQGMSEMTGSFQPVNGLSVKVAEDKAPDIIEKLLPQLLAGYRAFYSSRDGLGTPEIAIIKSDDAFDILRLKGTSAGNFDLETQDIIARLQQWQTQCQFEIYGAAHDWVALHFETLPTDVNAFADEIYEFCPDTIDQHFGCFGDMAEAMEEEGQEMPEELQAMMEGLDWNDPDAAGLELLKRSLQQTKSLFLWWD